MDISVVIPFFNEAESLGELVSWIHQVLRENKQATGAGADRVSSGMRHAFGKAVGTAARVDAGQKVFSVSTTSTNVAQAKMALRRAGQKLPTPRSRRIPPGLKSN